MPTKHSVSAAPNQFNNRWLPAVLVGAVVCWVTIWQWQTFGAGDRAELRLEPAPTEASALARAVDGQLIRAALSPGSGSASSAMPGPPTRTTDGRVVSAWESSAPLVDRLDAMRHAAERGDASAATMIASELKSCHDYELARQLAEARISVPGRSEAARTAAEEEYVELVAMNERREAVCAGLQLPELDDIAAWAERGAENGSVEAMLLYSMLVDEDRHLANLARRPNGELARVRQNQTRFVREAARQCNVNAFTLLVMRPHLTSSPTEGYAFFILAGWLLTGNPAPGSAAYQRLSGQSLTQAQEQAALRYANAFFRRYC